MSFTSFLREKQYLENVSTNTLRWYKHALKWLPSESPDERALKNMVIRMREKGLKATGCNAAIRAINCYLRWSGSPHTIHQLREPQLVLPTFSNEQVKLLVSYKPKTDFQRLLHLLILILLDTGCRISEALSIRSSDIDWIACSSRSTVKDGRTGRFQSPLSCVKFCSSIWKEGTDCSWNRQANHGEEWGLYVL